MKPIPTRRSAARRAADSLANALIAAGAGLWHALEVHWWLPIAITLPVLYYVNTP